VTPYRYSDSVYAAFGRAAHAAQLLEKQLETFLLLPEFQKKGKISTATFAKSPARPRKIASWTACE
jgi:hypothetical protein